MEKFKKVLKRKIALMSIFNALVIIFIAVTVAYGNRSIGGSENISDMIHGFQVGFFVGLQLVMVKYIGKYGNALRDEEKLKKLYVEENDERTKLIGDKIGGIGFNFTLGALATASVISGFFNEIVFATLAGVLIFSVLVKGSLKLYYRQKF